MKEGKVRVNAVAVRSWGQFSVSNVCLAVAGIVSTQSLTFAGGMSHKSSVETT